MGNFSLNNSMFWNIASTHIISNIRPSVRNIFAGEGPRAPQRGESENLSDGSGGVENYPEGGMRTIRVSPCDFRDLSRVFASAFLIWP